MNSLRKGEGFPLLNFEGGPLALLPLLHHAEVYFFAQKRVM